jgi:hypothetical protein
VAIAGSSLVPVAVRSSEAAIPLSGSLDFLQINVKGNDLLLLCVDFLLFV